MQWSELKLDLKLCNVLLSLDYKVPTEIQTKSIGSILCGKDLVGGSATGSGKTLAFGLPIIQKVDASKKGVEALIVCPTRELALQVNDEIKKVALKYNKDIKVVPIYGGADFQRQAIQLVKGAKIVVGTPGRVLDHIKRKSLKLKNCTTLVLDEADEMLSMGFRPDIESIIAKFKSKPQMLLFSATMPKEIVALVDKYLQEPKFVMIENANKPSNNVKQFYINVGKNSKIDALFKVVEMLKNERALIFCNTKAMTENISSHLNKLKYKCDTLNGDMNQKIRKRVLDAFRAGKLQFLICTDVASRGLDIDNLQYVINYDLPKLNEWYIHRIGRTGRMQNKGTSYTLINKQEHLQQLKLFAKENGFEINELVINVENSVKNKNNTAETKSNVKKVDKQRIENQQNKTKQPLKNQKNKYFDKKVKKINKKDLQKTKRQKEKSFLRTFDFEQMTENDFNSLFEKNTNKPKRK